MDDIRIKEWAKLLLDLGKRNNLLNFKDSKKTSAEIVAPDVGRIFEKAQGESVFEVYDPKIRFDEESEIIEDGKINREEYIRTYTERIKTEKQILVYNAMSPLYAIKEIRKKAKSAIEETGVNIAHLAFGFVHWKDTDEGESVYRAPLLLVPISIPESSRFEPFQIKTLGEDIVVNPTLSYKLSNEYGYELPEYQDQSLDEYIDSVKKVVSVIGWNVTSDCKIGLFSFLKINMYHDLMNNTDNIHSCNIIKALLDEIDADDDFFDYSSYKRLDNPIIELHNVVDADSSQIEAIEMAKSGESFVLQGPPGTGKSQTITNIIAECLHDGKKVLFVSEKQAALNVVFDKLKKAGLEDFCLELHSYKANKKDFINNINDSLSSERKAVSKDALYEIEKKKRMMAELDAYESELHKIRPVINQSLYQMYDNYSSCRIVENETQYVIQDITNKDLTYLDKVMDLLKRYFDFTKTIGNNYKNNPWYGYINRDLSYRKKEELNNKMIVLSGILSNLNSIRNDINTDYELNCASINDLEVWKKFFGVASKSNFMTPTFFKNAAFEYTYEKLDFLENHSKDILSLKEIISNNYDLEVVDINSEDYLKLFERQYNSFFSRLFNSEYKEIIKEIRLFNKQGKKESYSNAVALLKNINTYKAKLNEFQEQNEVIKEGFGNSYNGVYTNWQDLKLDFACLKDMYSRGDTFGKLEELSVEIYNSNKDAFSTYCTVLDNALEQSKELTEYILNSFEKGVFDIRNDSLEKTIEKISGCIENIDGLENWIHFMSLLDEFNEVGIRGFIDSSISSNIVPKYVDIAFKKTFYHQWIEDTIRSVNILSKFNEVEHNSVLKEFVDKDREQFTISKAEIRSYLYNTRPLTDIVPANSPIAIIRHEAGKKRKQKSIRSLLSETGELIQTLKPLFLMSPLSVSTFLDTDKIRFDTVVFDEASQIFPQDAIGSIYRGKQLIVVGDSKQMPPSNFFAAGIDVDEEDDTEDIDDFESILDLCSTKFKQLLLKWHYRSKFEELIAFSNKNYYKNELVTFPSYKKGKEDTGVNFYKVEGTYDRTSRTNRIEAEKVVDLVFEHAKHHPERSLGVVAFNISQQSLIEKLINKKRESDASLDEFFNPNNKEPFFIKNLETVQGDERDTIIFSVAYAKDTTGRFIANFGPLNKVGGERRLNVAVTRAKYNVKLVSSLRCTDIPTSENIGSRLLREYLDYAENGSVALERSLNVSDNDHYDSDFEIEVCDFLRDKGFVVDTQVGCSSFRIDMGVKKPDTSDYVIAIECDGATYHSSKNARDRDRLRQQILESMGWRFYRIWSTDWFRNKENAKKKLLEAVNKALNNTSDNICHIEEESNDDLTTIENSTEAHLVFPIYKIVDDEYALKKHKYSFMEALKEMLDTEAPLSEEWLLKRICWFFDRDKVTSYVREQFALYMYKAKAYGIIRRNGFLYLDNVKTYVLRVPDGDIKREIEYISYEELAAGMYHIIKNNVAVDLDSLYLSLAKTLGFSKVTDKVRCRFDDALKCISNRTESENGIIRLKQ